MTTLSDAEMEAVKREIARVSTPEWQYDAGWNSANMDAFLGVRNDEKLESDGVSDAWKRGYMDCWNIRKQRIRRAMELTTWKSK